MLTELTTLLDLLRAKGVTHYEGSLNEKGNFVKVDLSLAEAKAEKAETDSEVCACGHHVTMHQDGGCLKGCDDKECNP